MEKRPFTDKSLRPVNDKLKIVLGKSFKFYTALDKSTPEFKKEWNFSGSSGWMQKVYDGKKALYYLIPLERSFLISMTLREKEKAEFLSDSAFHTLYELLKNAKKYSEGFALRFLIEDEVTFLEFSTFIKKLINKRK